MLILGICLYVLGPSLAATFSSWPHLESVYPAWFGAMAVAQVASTACLIWVQALGMRTHAWFAAVTAELAGGALSRCVPGGTALAAAVQYTMLTRAGVPAASVASGLTAASLLTLATVLALPIVSLPVILAGVPIPEGLAEAGWIGLGVFGLILLAAWAVLRSDRPLTVAGRVVQVLVNRVRRRRRTPMADPSDRLIAERDAVKTVLGEHTAEAIVASVGRWLFDYLTLLAALTAVGANPSPVLVLLAFVAAQMLDTISITPGGIGLVEAGLTGTLALAGVGAADALTATLAYRLFSYWLPMPVGLVAWWLYRRRYSRSRMDTSPRGPEAAP